MKHTQSRVRCPTCGHAALKHVSRTVATKVGKRSISVPNVAVDECSHCSKRLYDMAALGVTRKARETARHRSAA